MDLSQNRKIKRSQTWPDTTATLKVDDTFNAERRGSISFKGKVGDLSSGGMFFETVEAVPVPAKAEIKIDFNSSSSRSRLIVHASGETVRATKNGVGIKFTAIDLAQLQQCIIAKMNRAG